MRTKLMRKISSIALAAALGLATAATPLLASAQAAGGAAPGAAQQQAPRERPSRIEGRIAFLKAELKITDAQTAQWNAVADAMRKNDAAKRDLRRQMHGQRQQGAANAVDALARREQVAETRAEGARQFLAAFRPLYAGLSDEQKRTADELLGRHGGRGHHRGWRH
jgi:LTXXQ motif family protein